MSQVEDIIRYARECAWLFHAPTVPPTPPSRSTATSRPTPLGASASGTGSSYAFSSNTAEPPTPSCLTTPSTRSGPSPSTTDPRCPFVRVAEHEGDVYIDLANENWMR